MNKKLDKLYSATRKVNIDNNTKIVIMSDCHRGSGNNYDNFIKNQNIFSSALEYYYTRSFIYIELGDGDEMWEVKNCEEIVENYLDIFKLLKKFNDSNRLIMIYGNHDIVKKYPKVLKKCFYKYYDKTTKKEEKLLDGLVVHESLILNYKDYDMFLIHGHQVDFLNSNLWRLSRFLVRYIWKNIEKFGIKAPIGSAKNNEPTTITEIKLKDWSIKNNKIIITGHTHRPIFPKNEKSLHFNDGSCIHPNGITAIEIENGYITLVRWYFKVESDKTIFVKRNVIAESKPLTKFFENN